MLKTLLMKQLLLCIILFNVIISKAQIPSYSNGPKVEMIKIDSFNRHIDSFKNGVFALDERMILKMTNTTAQPYFTAVIDIQPDNIISAVMPYPDINLYMDDCKILPGETKIYKNFPISFIPPYGVDKLLTIFSPDPGTLEWLINAIKKISVRAASITKETYQQEIKWIL